ncbi:MAG: polysaccharide biosynthesis tyrosine autokinase [Erythrobacter sp.]|nr:MAG: polysaccharide biosynthesis tyrosine autokinase [Erythrobacter sp.]
MTRTPSFVDRYLPDRGEAYRDAAPAKVLSAEALRAMLWRQRFILVTVITFALLLGFIFYLLATPVFQATASVRVDLNTGGRQLVEGQELADPYVPTNQIATELETLSQVIASRSMARNVVDSLDLQNSATLLGDLVTEGPPAGMDEESFAQQRREAAVSMVRAGVSTEIPPNTQIISISFASRDRVLAAQIANSYAENFLADDLNRSIAANAYAREFLEEQIADVRGQLGEAEVSANQYARANRIIGEPLQMASEDGSESGSAPTLAAANLMQVNQAFGDARAARIAAEQRWLAIANVPAAQLPEVQQNSTIQTLRTQLAQRSSALADLQERYREDYPEVRELQSEISVLERQIARASEEIKAGIRNEYRVAQRQEVGLQQELLSVTDASLDEQDLQIQRSQLDREVVSLRDQLAALMERYNQISAVANLRSSKVTPLDPAIVPTVPSSPNLLNNLIVALVLGIGLAAAIALLREILDDRLHSIDDVENRLGMPAIGQTPFVSEQAAEELEDPFSPLSEAYSSIRASLDFALSTGEQKVIQFTSSQPAEGKTTSCVAVAQKYASVGRKVLLIDLDLRRPSVARHLGMAKSDVGVVDVLFGRVTLAQAVKKSTQGNLDVLPVAAIPREPVEILSSALVAEMLKQARETYDIVLIDSSPVIGIADAPLLSRFVDAVVFVVEANRANGRVTRSAVRRLRDMNAHIVGAIVTKFRALEAGQGYNYQYQYYSYEAKA